MQSIPYFSFLNCITYSSQSHFFLLIWIESLFLHLVLSRHTFWTDNHVSSWVFIADQRQVVLLYICNRFCDTFFIVAAFSFKHIFVSYYIFGLIYRYSCYMKFEILLVAIFCSFIILYKCALSLVPCYILLHDLALNIFKHHCLLLHGVC